MAPSFLTFPYVLVLIWAAAGLAAAFVLPKIRPHLFYLAVFYALVLSFSWTVYTVALRGVFFRLQFQALTRNLLILLPWAGILLAFWWRVQSGRLVSTRRSGFDPLRKRLLVFGGILLVDVVLLCVAEIIFANYILRLTRPAWILIENTLRYHLPALASVAVVLALLVPRLRPARIWIASAVIITVLLQALRYAMLFIPGLYRLTLPYGAYYNQLFHFAPFLVLILVLPLVARARRFA